MIRRTPRDDGVTVKVREVVTPVVCMVDPRTPDRMGRSYSGLFGTVSEVFVDIGSGDS